MFKEAVVSTSCYKKNALVLNSESFGEKKFQLHFNTNFLREQETPNSPIAKYLLSAKAKHLIAYVL